ncbi:MAG: exodeoxyribonuclease VII small subunit [Bacteroidaceae bacterium]|nr:exodeoxyribonuclease VII small subunit [Bacteroidaceae bacterium]MBP5323516.1 exodeoxyribonuclease VII small subunit [Bacteroidaceae bacterium]
MKYEDAVKQLDEIVSKVENNELEIDELTAQLKKAQELIKFCRDTLYKTDEEVKKLLEE